MSDIVKFVNVDSDILKNTEESGKKLYKHQT